MKNLGAQARPVGSILKWIVPGSRELVEGAVPTQLSDCCQGCCSRYSRSILGALWAPTEDRVAGGPWVAADSPQDTALMTGGQRQAQVAQSTGGSPAWRADVPPGDRTDVSGGSSSQAFSESPPVLPAVEVWKSTRGLFLAKPGGCGAR